MTGAFYINGITGVKKSHRKINPDVTKSKGVNSGLVCAKGYTVARKESKKTREGYVALLVRDILMFSRVLVDGGPCRQSIVRIFTVEDAVLIVLIVHNPHQKI